jgi:NAD-dependent dihydropyrimidine dehydrogenase PreA subunit
VSGKPTAGERLAGVFIDVEVDGSIADDAGLAAKLAEVCPVDIFTAENGRVETVVENLDECVLCELCLDAAPDGAVAVKKLYDGTELRRTAP